MSPKHLVAALSLAFGLGLPVLAHAQPDRPVAVESPDELLGRAVFQVLLGEIALQRGAVGLAADAWADLAERSLDPQALARATEIAGFAGQTDRALTLVQRWLAVEPGASRALQAQVALLIQMRRLDELAPQLTALLARDPDNLASNLLHLNRMLARVGDKAAVLQLVQQVTQPYEQQPEARFAVTQAAMAAGDNALALQSAEQALQLRPDWEIAAITRAQLLSRQDAGAGIRALERFVQSSKDSRDARLALARLLVSEKRYGDARKQYEYLVKAHPQDPNILYPIAILALQNGDQETGRQHLEKLLDTPFPDKSSIHYFLGQIAEEAKDMPRALLHFRQVTAGERFVPARARSAQILLSQGKSDEALQLLSDTRGATPAERAQLSLAEAQLLRDAGRPADAFAVLDKTLASQPDNPELLYDAALSAERIGLFDRMESLLRHLLTLQPENAHALNALGYSFADRNIRLPEAEQLIAQAVALAPEDPYIMDSLGWVQFRLGRLEEALKTLERAHQIKADPEIAAHLGEVLWHLSRQDEARRIWQEARERHPDNAALSETVKKFLP